MAMHFLLLVFERNQLHPNTEASLRGPSNRGTLDDEVSSAFLSTAPRIPRCKVLSKQLSRLCGADAVVPI